MLDFLASNAHCEVLELVVIERVVHFQAPVGVFQMLIEQAGVLGCLSGVLAISC